jgi:hypothetical protein
MAQQATALVERYEAMHRGIAFSIIKSGDAWDYSFAIGGAVKSGKIHTKLGLLAVRRAKMRIDRCLKSLA